MVVSEGPYLQAKPGGQKQMLEDRVILRVEKVAGHCHQDTELEGQASQAT